MVVDPRFAFAPKSSPWVEVPRSQIEKAISKQVPEFHPKSRKMLTEADDLEKAADEVERDNKDEISWSLCFLPSFIASLFRSGFLPIACNMGGDDALYVLLPKLHAMRCICSWKDVHVSRKTRRQSSKYYMTFNTCFNRVADKVNEQHANSWLYPPLRNALEVLNKGRGPLACVVSVELWDIESGELTAGELGVLVGSVYTSLTGFCDKNKYSGSGTVQLAALAGVLREAGATFWDLGMGLDYKANLGGQDIPRTDFLKMFRSSACTPYINLPVGQVSAKEAIASLILWQNQLSCFLLCAK